MENKVFILFSAAFGKWRRPNILLWRRPLLGSEKLLPYVLPAGVSSMVLTLDPFMNTAGPYCGQDWCFRPGRERCFGSALGEGAAAVALLCSFHINNINFLNS